MFSSLEKNGSFDQRHRLERPRAQSQARGHPAIRGHDPRHPRRGLRRHRHEPDVHPQGDHERQRRPRHDEHGRRPRRSVPHHLDADPHHHRQVRPGGHEGGQPQRGRHLRALQPCKEVRQVADHPRDGRRRGASCRRHPHPRRHRHDGHRGPAHGRLLLRRHRRQPEHRRPRHHRHPVHPVCHAACGHLDHRQVLRAGHDAVVPLPGHLGPRPRHRQRRHPARAQPDPRHHVPL